MDDNTIISEILAGEPRSFRLLVDKYRHMAFTIALRITGNREDAEEAAQDAFVNAYKSLRSFNGNFKFSTWLYKIAYNSAISLIRKRKKVFLETIDENHDIQAGAINAESVMIADEEKARVTKAIASLPGQDGVIITLYYLDEQSVSDISKITGLSEANIKVKLHRSRKKLAEILKPLIGESV